MKWPWQNTKQIEVQSKEIERLNSELKDLQSRNDYYFSGRSYPVITNYYDGEKNPGEMGVFVNAIPNFRGLRYRVYEATLKKDLIGIITGKFFKWVAGTGLKLQAQPSFEVLKSEGVSIADAAVAEFMKRAESRFEVYAAGKMSDYKKMGSLHTNAWDGFKTAFLSGDALCVLRVDENNNVSMQVIDGQHITSPLPGDVLTKAAEDRGNSIDNGVETNAKGEHVAFYVETREKGSIAPKHERVLARGEKTGRLMAWLICTDKHRIDHARGVPKIAAILEKVEKLDRYTEAMVGKAEEVAKMVIAVQHSRDSDGENPLMQNAKVAIGMNNNAAEETTGYHAGEKTALDIKANTGKQAINLPIGAELKAIQSDFESQYEGFSRAVFNYICASVDIPPEVALQLYEQNYSSSRAAIMMWQYIVDFYRKKCLSDQFYQPFYNLWLELEIIKNKIDAPGYIAALRQNSFMVVEAYQKASFVGPNMPHIDPLKEVNAVRKALGDEKTPLITHEQATAKVNGGDWEKNITQYKKEVDNFLSDFKSPTQSAQEPMPETDNPDEE